MFTIFTFSTPRRIGIVLSSVHTLAMGSILQVHFSVGYYEKKYNLSHNLKIGFCKKKFLLECRIRIKLSHRLCLISLTIHDRTRPRDSHFHDERWREDGHRRHRRQSHRCDYCLSCWAWPAWWAPPSRGRTSRWWPRRASGLGESSASRRWWSPAASPCTSGARRTSCRRWRPSCRSCAWGEGCCCRCCWDWWRFLIIWDHHPETVMFSQQF